jgi:alkylation response protein AidB-like acyl-CoA dehydrogenase
MDFDDNAADAEYRSQLRKFLQTHHAELEHGDGEYLVEPGVDNVEALRRTQALLFDAGYVGVTWPWRYGGQSGTPSQQAIVTEELARASIPALINYLGIGMCGPTILAHGSEDQKNRYLRRLLRADDIWCQLFSEPGSGSDLAVLRENAGALWERARLVAAVIMAAEDLGAADAAVAIAADYGRSRQTFGRAIGSYQAVKHRLVDVWAGVEQLRSLVWWAAWTADAAPDDLPLAASAVKAYSARVLEEAAEALIHVHGGIGFTWEHDAHVYWRRAKVDRLLLGDEAEYLDRVADLALTGARL